MGNCGDSEVIMSASWIICIIFIIVSALYIAVVCDFALYIKRQSKLLRFFAAGYEEIFDRYIALSENYDNLLDAYKVAHRILEDNGLLSDADAGR